MQKKIKHRLIITLCCMLSVFLGVAIILYNIEQNITFFYPPAKLTKEFINREIRVGGLVKIGSIKHISLGQIYFIITDGIKDIEIYYKGILPALFRENQGIVAKGKLNPKIANQNLSLENEIIKASSEELSNKIWEDNIFIASELLTKHDENYMPPRIEQNNY